MDNILSDVSSRNLTHDVLVTFMAEVIGIVNARPITPVSSDPENPAVLSPSMILTQKSDAVDNSLGNVELKDLYKAQWRRVQFMAELFWQRWRNEYLQQLQVRRKWQSDRPNLKTGDVVLLKDKSVHRNEWPMGRIVNAIPSDDGNIRKAEVRIFKNDKFCTYTRPITEMVILLEQ